MSEIWPELPLPAWRDTYATLHRYLQIVGKVRLALAPMENHWWHVAFHLTARGLTTRATPHGPEVFDIDLDFIDHELRINTSDGKKSVLGLEARPVAEMYRDLMATLRSLGIGVQIWDVPVEIADDTTPFGKDWHHASYDPQWAYRCWRALAESASVLQEFRGRFTGKSSPVHFFWGSFDLALTRFSGRRAPERLGADAVTREAYAEECWSCGWWPGDGRYSEPAYYAYAWPEPPGFASAEMKPAAAFYHRELSEYLLPYEAVRSSRDGRRMLLEFLQSSYAAAAERGNWERAALERPLIKPRRTMSCRHIDAVRDQVQPSTTEGCEDCLKTGASWVQLRMCLTCGHVGCCDSSPNRHATKHFHQTTHPLMQSMEEEWAWCYVDELMLQPGDFAGRPASP